MKYRLAVFSDLGTVGSVFGMLPPDMICLGMDKAEDTPVEQNPFQQHLWLEFEDRLRELDKGQADAHPHQRRHDRRRAVQDEGRLRLPAPHQQQVEGGVQDPSA